MNEEPATLTLMQAAETVVQKAMELIGKIVRDDELFEAIKYNVDSLGPDGVLMYVSTFGAAHEDAILQMDVNALLAEISSYSPAVYTVCQDADVSDLHRAAKILRVLYRLTQEINSAN